MKDPTYTIRNVYSQLLPGNIFHKGTPVPVYDEYAPKTAVAPYIILGAQTLYQQGNRCTFKSDCSITVIVVTAFPAAEPGNKKFADDIGNQITQIILPIPGTNIDLQPDFSCDRTKIDGINSSSSQDNTYKYIEKAIRFNHIVREL